MRKINRCPFCGGNAVTEHATFKNPTENRCAIVCEVCGAYGPPLIGSNKESVERYAIRLWNHRDVTISALYGFEAAEREYERREVCMTDLDKRIDEEIGGKEGWLKSSTGETFRKMGSIMKRRSNMDDDLILDILGNLHAATADEYRD